jgi:hypothetical protein
VAALAKIRGSRNTTPRQLLEKSWQGWSSLSRQRRYHFEDGRALIEVRVKKPRQLFDVRDPAPFRERDLDDELVEYILSCAEEFSAKQEFKIVVHLTEVADPELHASAISSAVSQYFSFEADLKRRQLTHVLRTAQFFLLIGLSTLFICLGVAHSIDDSKWPQAILREGLVIFGWVAMWRPIELVLYDWWPHWGRVKLLRKLATSPVQVLEP